MCFAVSDYEFAYFFALHPTKSQRKLSVFIVRHSIHELVQRDFTAMISWAKPSKKDEQENIANIRCCDVDNMTVATHKSPRNLSSPLLFFGARVSKRRCSYFAHAQSWL